MMFGLHLMRLSEHYTKNGRVNVPADLPTMEALWLKYEGSALYIILSYRQDMLDRLKAAAHDDFTKNCVRQMKKRRRAIIDRVCKAMGQAKDNALRQAMVDGKMSYAQIPAIAATCHTCGLDIPKQPMRRRRNKK